MSYHDNPIYVTAKRFLFEALYRGGLCAVSRHRHRNSVLVLTYHDILPPGFPRDNVLFGMTVNTEEFEWHLDHIQKHYNPLSLTQFCSWLLGEGSLPPRSILITFDDGHSNNIQYALPALQKRAMPAVCFVVAGNMGKRHLLAVEEGYARLLSRDAKIWVSMDGKRHVLDSLHNRGAACSYFFRLLRAHSEEDQHKELESLRLQIPTLEDGTEFPKRFEFLSPGELRTLEENNIAIGAHSVTHPVLATLGAERARAEIADGKSCLEQVIGNAVYAFAYPFGEPGADFGEREKELVQKAGYSLAFAGVPGFVKKDSDPLCLPRIGVGRMTHAHFVATITGVLDTLKRFLGTP